MKTALILASLAAPTFLLVSLAPTARSAGEGGEGDELPEAPIAAVLAAQTEDVRRFNDHLVTLASPFMEGRLPGTRGMELAKEYVEFWMKAAGLEPAFQGEDGEPSFRQRFPLSGVPELAEQGLVVDGRELTPDDDFAALSLGASGWAHGPAVFVGYSIDNGEGDYSSYAEDDHLAGRIAVLFRFEPMDAEGNSRWASSGWSNQASFANKVRGAAARGATGIVVINPPGCADERSESLPGFSMGRSNTDVPIVVVTSEAAQAIFAGSGKSVMDMRAHADEGGPIIPLDIEVRVSCKIVIEDVTAENVGGLIPGRGDLASEYIVIGAHMDHLGMGFFGSRDQESAGKELHPGADDNASGTAGILLLADKLVQDYAAMPEERPLRTVLVIAFSAEESGLNGAQYYVEHPLADASQHALMMNFDMIGRIANKRLAVSGLGSAVGMADWMEPLLEASPLDVQPAEGGGGGSDHLAFLSAEIPAIFAIIADFHQDYHTPRDTSDKINRVDAVEAAYLWREIALVAAQRSEPFEFVRQARGGRRPMKVRFGITLGQAAEDLRGVAVDDLTTGGAAEASGILPGDRLVSWDGEEIEDVRAWMGMLAGHEPGDEVRVGIERDGEPLEIRVVLEAP